MTKKLCGCTGVINMDEDGEEGKVKLLEVALVVASELDKGASNCTSTERSTSKAQGSIYLGTKQ